VPFTYEDKKKKSLTPSPSPRGEGSNMQG